MNIILATNNQNKVKEINNKLETYNLDYNVKSLNDVNFTEDIEEFGKTFEQNALIKAQVIANLFPNDIIIADDSGLCVEALNNEPGVYSARYASEESLYKTNKDEANLQKLLFMLKNIDNRQAYFVTVLCIIKPSELPIFIKGEVHGQIIDERKGTDGFGYDPIFTHDGISTFAQLTKEQKNEVSHRSRAITAMFEKGIL